MKKITLLFLLLLGFSFASYGQCTSTSGGLWPQTPVTVQNTGGAETIATNNWPNAEVSFVQGLVIGNTYTITGTNASTVYITVSETPADFSATGTILTHGASTVSFTATTAQIRVFWHLDAACNTQDSGNTVTTIQCTSASCTCVETAAPSAATTPVPADMAMDIPIDYTDPTSLLITPFSWVDGTLGGNITGTTLSLGTNTAGDDIGTLTNPTNGAGITYTWQPGTTYYWSITSENCFGSTQSAVWSFTTSACTVSAPGVASAPNPANSATNVEITYGDPNQIIFEWADSMDADSYTINIGETFAGNDLGSVPGFESGGAINFNWQPNTVYYWSIDAVNCAGTTAGPIWSFTTSACAEVAAPAAATSPNPANMATGVAIQGPDGTVSFNWTAAGPGVSYILNLGTSNPPTQSFNNFENGDPITGLSVDTTYYWSIDTVNCFGTTTGPVWEFTTNAQLSVDDNQINEFTVFPNPTNDILNIKSSVEIDNVSVFNLLGQEVARFGKNDIVDSAINISDLESGLYMVQIISGNNTQIVKVTKK